jgi:hypothetical protein
MKAAASFACGLGRQLLEICQMFALSLAEDTLRME